MNIYSIRYIQTIAITLVSSFLFINNIQAIEECTIDLKNNNHTCSGYISIKSLNSNMALAKITLNHAVSESGYAQAVFKISYDKDPSGFTVNIGDSVSNNGGSGDGMDQHNDSETEIQGKTMNVFGSDEIIPPDSKLLEKIDNFVKAGDIITLTICNESLGWNSPSAKGKLKSEYIYALNGQEEKKSWGPWLNHGKVNYDIYAAFNRVVDGTYRNGSGVSKVSITLFKQCTLPIELKDFSATSEKDNIHLVWETSIEIDNAGTNIWCAQMKNNEFKEVTRLNSELITAEGSSREKNTYSKNYSAKDSGVKPGINYCVLEDISTNGKCTTHCNSINAIIVDRSEESSENIDLEAAQILCGKYIKTQLEAFGKTGSCINSSLDSLNY